MLTFLTHYAAAGGLSPSLTWNSLSYTAMSLRHVGAVHSMHCILEDASVQAVHALVDWYQFRMRLQDVLHRSARSLQG